MTPHTVTALLNSQGSVIEDCIEIDHPERGRLFEVLLTYNPLHQPEAIEGLRMVGFRKEAPGVFGIRYTIWLKETV